MFPQCTLPACQSTWSRICYPRRRGEMVTCSGQGGVLKGPQQQSRRQLACLAAPGTRQSLRHLLKATPQPPLPRLLGRAPEAAEHSFVLGRRLGDGPLGAHHLHGVLLLAGFAVLALIQLGLGHAILPQDLWGTQVDGGVSGQPRRGARLSTETMWRVATCVSWSSSTFFGGRTLVKKRCRRLPGLWELICSLLR